MGRGLNRVTAVKVTSLKVPGYYADGGNLYLRIAPGRSKGWIFRFTIAGRTRDAGLGSYPEISLVKAREEAERRRRLVAAGVEFLVLRHGLGSFYYLRGDRAGRKTAPGSLELGAITCAISDISAESPKFFGSLNDLEGLFPRSCPSSGQPIISRQLSH